MRSKLTKMEGHTAWLWRLVLAGCLFAASVVTCLGSTISLQWDPETDPTVAGYKVYYSTNPTGPFTGIGATQGPSPVDVSAQTNATITGLDPGQPYYFAVTAYDTTGAESAYSALVTVPELVPPTVAIASPANNTTASGVLSVSANATDNVGVTRVELYVNGGLQAIDTATPYTFAWDTSALAAGPYTLSVKAYDAAGNVGTSSDVTLNVLHDATAPTVSLTAPASGVTLSGTVSIIASAADNVGVTKVEYYANGALLSAGNVAPYTYSWNTASVANGSYTLVSKAYDATGNVAQSAPVTVTVLNDTSAPTIGTFSMPATSGTLSVPVTLSATDNVAVTGYLVSESSTAPAVSASGWRSGAPTSFTFAGYGTRTAYAWAKDAAGNVSASALASVTISDVTPPTVTTFSMPSSTTTLTVPVALAATDNLGVTGYLISESSATPTATTTGWSAGAPTGFTFAGGGTRTAYAWAKDAAGNVSAASSVSVTISVADTAAPVIGTFALPASASSTTVAVSLAATDNTAVTGYLVSESATTPLAGDSRWTASAPASFTCAGTGTRTVYAWAKDAAGNVSAAKSDTILIDTIAPAITALTSGTSGSFVNLTASATDNVAVTTMQLFIDSKLLLQTSASNFSYSWKVTSKGTHTITVKAYDAAGNATSQSTTVVK